VNNGLNALGINSILNSAAQEQSDYQARNSIMTHDGDNGSSPGDRITNAGYDWTSCAENVAYGYGDEDTCMEAWMKSAGHRKNILSPKATHFGSAMTKSSDGTPYYTQDFAMNGRDGDKSYPICPGSSADSDRSLEQNPVSYDATQDDAASDDGTQYYTVPDDTVADDGTQYYTVPDDSSDYADTDDTVWVTPDDGDDDWVTLDDGSDSGDGYVVVDDSNDDDY